MTETMDAMVRTAPK